jgi:acyl-CoA thioester hydrolase
VRFGWDERTGKYLEAETRVRVRFHEVDALRVVWHGHYLAYFEEGRNAFGRKYGLDYEDLYRAGFTAPVVHVEIDYAAPARFGDELVVRARLYPDFGARLNFAYLVCDAAGRPLAHGKSVQVFTEIGGELALTRPPFYQSFLDRWESELRGQ